MIKWNKTESVRQTQARKLRVENRNLENRRRPGCGESAPPIHQKSYTLYLASLEDYLHSNPPDYRFQVDSLLELLYYAFTEYNITESPEFKAKIGPLDRKLRELAETDEAADEYMNVVYSLCAAYERQSYVEGIKVGARLMMEMMEMMEPVTE